MCIDLQMLSAYMDGELKEPYKTQVKEHLEHCAACRNLLEDMKRLDEKIQKDVFLEEELNRNKDAIYKKLDAKCFGEGRQVSFFRRKIQMSIPTAITAAAAAVFIFVGGFVFFGSNAKETNDILPSFSVNADSENVRLVSSGKNSLDDYTLEEILSAEDKDVY